MTSRGALLGVHRVAADEQAVERQRLEQRPRGERLVLAPGHRPLGDGDARAGAEGGDDVQGERPGRAVEGAPERLAVDGEHPVAGGAEIVEEGLEVIGAALDEKAIRAALDACLVGTDSFAPEACTGLPDPFPAWGVRAAA
jgi:hypothetical protein